MDSIFKKVTSAKDIKEVFDYTIAAFSDPPDFKWTLEDIKKEIKDGWELYSVTSEEEVIAAIFMKKEGKRLLTKNTSIKIGHHGNSYSHQIKEFCEEQAKKLKTSEIIHYCRIDNFRMYSLNEGCDYKKLPQEEWEDELVVEWSKKIK